MMARPDTEERAVSILGDINVLSHGAEVYACQAGKSRSRAAALEQARDVGTDLPISGGGDAADKAAGVGTRVGSDVEAGVLSQETGGVSRDLGILADHRVGLVLSAAVVIHPGGAGCAGVGEKAAAIGVGADVG